MGLRLELIKAGAIEGLKAVLEGRPGTSANAKTAAAGALKELTGTDEALDDTVGALLQQLRGAEAGPAQEAAARSLAALTHRNTRFPPPPPLPPPVRPSLPLPLQSYRTACNTAGADAPTTTQSTSLDTGLHSSYYRSIRCISGIVFACMRPPTRRADYTIRGVLIAAPAPVVVLLSW